MSKDDAESAADVMPDCADIKELFTSAMGDNIPAEAQACIDENLTDEVLNKFLVAVFQNDHGERPAGDDHGARASAFSRVPDPAVHTTGHRRRLRS